MNTDAWIQTILKCPFCDTVLMQPKPPRKIKGVTVWCPTCKTADFKSAQPNPQRAARAPAHATSFPRPLKPTTYLDAHTPEARAFPQEPTSHHQQPRQATLSLNADITNALDSLNQKLHDAEHMNTPIPTTPADLDAAVSTIREIPLDMRGGAPDQTKDREGLQP